MTDPRPDPSPAAAPVPDLEEVSSPKIGGRLGDMSRRKFLRTGSLTMAAAAAVSAIPGLPSILGDAEADAPGASSAAAGTAPALGSEASGLASPVTAHVSDLSGELSLFVENRTVVVRDPALVARLLAASR